jgi:methionyl-tRNA formyltransferase
MFLNDVSMVAADTTRTKAYIHALIRHRLLPKYVLLLNNETDKLLPGQIDKQVNIGNNLSIAQQADDDWSEASFDQTISLVTLLESSKIPYDIAPNSDINDQDVVKLICRRPESIFIFSGFGGVLLRQNILSTGKRFLHIHGGYLPNYKGSTTNYYSMIVDGSMGASAIFLTEDIDGGPILLRRRFSVPREKESIDHVFDSAARAKVLVMILQLYVDSNKWEFELESNQGGETYYVIHPVLKHIAILKDYK